LSKDDAATYRTDVMEIEIPDDYQVVWIEHLWKLHQFYEGGDPHIDDKTDYDQWFGKSGKFPVIVVSKLCYTFTLEVRVQGWLRDEVYSAWKLKVCNALREAALARYEENRQNLKQRLSSLLEELGAEDALSLRKIEREEVMKGVLRWLFGPSFEFAVAGVPEMMMGSDFPTSSKDTWAQIVSGTFMTEILAHGDIIKFLHHAIEWENMLYFLYPYFWSHPSRWELKKYLNHPDLMHRAFLKSGSARVVLTIRPGFEKDFVSCLETGKFGPLAGDSAYF